MPQIAQHAAGDFCWFELATSDQAAAKSFYASLFGWSANDLPMGPSDLYTIFSLEGRHTGAAYTLRPDDRAAGVPPHWVVYVAVESADQAAARAVQAGGEIMLAPTDVSDAGRMCFLRDPTGAYLAAWQPKTHPGSGIHGIAGTFCWADLMTPDPERAALFYSQVFGWRIEPPNRNDYRHIQNGRETIGGMHRPGGANAGVPPHWLLYWLVADCHAAAEKARQLGARVLHGPMDVETVGRMVVMADPQGAVSALFQALGGNNGGAQ